MLNSDLIASVGVFILLLAFTLNLAKRLPLEGVTYPALNFVGAAIAAYASWLVPFYPFVVLEGIWALASLVTLLMRFRGRSV